jgi:putative lipoic acid-binding regulatory protein
VAADDKSQEDEARVRTLALLEATHQFPCDYSVIVIAFNREGVTEAVLRAAGRAAEIKADEVASGGAGYESRASTAGKYLSHRLAVRVNHAVEVLDLYARLRSVEGIVTLL